MKSGRATFAAGVRPAHAPCFRIRLEDEVVYRCLRPRGHSGDHYDGELAARWADMQEAPAERLHEWTPDGAALASLLIGPRPGLS